jgi:hypothetical protein
MQFQPTWLELLLLPGSDGSRHTRLKEWGQQIVIDDFGVVSPVKSENRESLTMSALSRLHEVAHSQTD